VDDCILPKSLPFPTFLATGCVVVEDAGTEVVAEVLVGAAVEAAVAEATEAASFGPFDADDASVCGCCSCGGVGCGLSLLKSFPFGGMTGAYQSLS